MLLMTDSCSVIKFLHIARGSNLLQNTRHISYVLLRHASTWLFAARSAVLLRLETPAAKIGRHFPD
jgi:hypothetical protein